MMNQYLTVIISFYEIQLKIVNKMLLSTDQKIVISIDTPYHGK